MANKNSPLRQPKQVIPLRSLAQEAGNPEEARQSLVTRPAVRSHGVSDHAVAGRRGLQLRGVGEATGDDHAGQGARRRGGEGARGQVGAAGGGAKEGAEG